MAKTKVREVYLKESKGNFYLLSPKENKNEYDFDGLSSLRKILSKEKARILDVIKYEKPNSIYELAKKLKRPFKSVFDDVKLLQRFGFISFKQEKINNRYRHKPEIVVDQITIHVKV